MSKRHQPKSCAGKVLVYVARRGFRVDQSGVLLDPNGRRVATFQRRLGLRGSHYWMFSAYVPMFETSLDGVEPGTVCMLPVHRLAAFQKFGSALFAPKMVVRHGPGGSLDNRPENILIGTPKQNFLDRDPEDRRAAAAAGARARRKLTPGKVRKARRMRARGVPYEQIAATVGVSLVAVYRAILRRTYKDVE